MTRDKKVIMKLINNQCYISLINGRALQRICALNHIPLTKSSLRGYNNYYIEYTDLKQFIEVFTRKEYSVEFI